MGPNENNNFYQKQHLNNNNGFLLMEEQNSSSTTAASPFTQISTKPIHRIYSTNLIVEEEPTSTTTEELPEEWNNCVNQSLSGLTDLRVHELKTECKKRQLAVSGSKQQLIDRLQPFEHQIMLQQQKDSFILFNEEKMMKKKKNCVVVVDNNNIGESGGGGGGGCCCSSPSVIDAVIDSVIDGSGLTEERNLNSNNKNTKLDNKRCSNINKIKKESKIMMLKNNKQKRNGTSKITKQKDIFTLGNCNLIKKSKMIINGRWQSFLGNNLPPKENLSNVGCKCCSCGYNNNNSILKNKKMENNEECLENEVKSTENEVEEEEDKMEELKEEEENEEINEEESYKLEENQQSLENSRTFSFAQMGSGGQFTPLEPADISIVISENNKNCNNTIVEKKIVKEENLKQHVQNNFNNSKTFLEIPKTINNKRINLLSTDKQQQNIKNSNNNYCCQQCCCSPFPYLPPSLPSTSPCLDVCVPSLDNQQHQKQQQNEQNTCCFQQKHKVEQKQHLSAELVREENNNINNSKNTTCFYCVEEENLKQQTCFSENEQILSAATLSKHEEFLRQQQQKIAELQRELALSQIALQKHQQMLAEARQASQPRDPETGIVFGQVEYWLGQLINTHKEQQLTLQRQIIGQRTLVYTEQKLQEELHTEQAVQDICRLIGQESKTALLIVQLLRRYQLERSVNNDVVTQPHSENLINIQEEKEETETLSLTKIKRKNAKKQEKNQNATNNSNIKRKGGGGRSKSALEGLINSTKEEKNNASLKRSAACDCFDSSNVNQKRPHSSLGTTNSTTFPIGNDNNSVDMEEIFRSVLEGGDYVNQPNNSHTNINEEFTSNKNNYENLRETHIFIEDQQQQQQPYFNNNNIEMEKTMQDLMEVLQNDQYDCNVHCVNSTQTEHLANILAEEVELNRNNSSDIFSSSFNNTTSTLFQDSYTPQEQQQHHQQQTSTSFATQINQLEYKQNNNNISEDDSTLFFSSCEENERALDWLDTFDSFTTVF